jgi:carboxypeptidase C (cathepsin A)
MLFKARNKNASAPLILYFPGGPGTASGFNIFVDNGPYHADQEGVIRYNEYSWNNDFDVLYVDQPIGVGFSKVKDNSTICRNYVCMVENMYMFLVKWYE